MASKALPSHIFSSIARPTRRRVAIVFSASSSPSPCLHNQRASQRRQRSTASSPPQASTVDETSTPRWQNTPPATKAPVRIRGPEFDPNTTVNSDPKKLDGFYARMLGDHSDKTLSEEVKWQAVTHKSFDQGRRGFNDRLAYLGKQIVMLQASLALLEASPSKPPADPYNRVPYDHPSLQGVEVLSSNTRNKLLAKKKLSALAVDYGLQEVLRWLPRMPDNPLESGLEVILSHAMFAIVGAIALEKGGLVANEVARDRILKPLGFPIDVPRAGVKQS